MKTRKIISISLAVIMVVSAFGLAAFAADDVTEPVVAQPGENITVGNVTVEDSEIAVGATARDNTDASVIVNGDVSSGGAGRYGVGAYSEGGKATVISNGSVSVNSNEEAVAVYVYSGAEGSASAEIRREATSKGQYYATGIEAHNGNANVNGNVTAQGSYACGADIYADGKTNVNISGTASAEGVNAAGAYLYSYENEDGGAGDISFNAGNGIVVTGTGAGSDSDIEPYAAGIIVDNNGGKINADITGDINVKEPNGNASGIKIGGSGDGFIMEPTSAPKESTVIIHGNIISDGAGIEKRITTSNFIIDDPDNPGGEGDVPEETVNIIVEGIIDAGTAGVNVVNNEASWQFPDGIAPDDYVPDNTEPGDAGINLTVWKINLSSNGNAAECTGRAGSNVSEPGPAANFEKSINYIVKVEQPAEGGTIKAVDAQGNALEKIDVFDTAHEGDKIYLEADLEEGCKITAAYNGLGEKVPLLTDEEGRYYIVVPKGGGVYLSAEITREYMATFVADGKTVAKIPYTSETKSIEEPTVPEKEGYTGKWEKYELAEGGVTVKAVYTPVKPAGTPAIEIAGDKNVSLDYRQSKTFTASADGIPEGGKIEWYVDGKKAGEGEKFTVESPEKDYKVQAKIVDKDGKSVAESGTVNAAVKHGFFDKIRAWFRDMLLSILGPFFGNFEKVC